jgi:hypothetical protein
VGRQAHGDEFDGVRVAVVRAKAGDPVPNVRLGVVIPELDGRFAEPLNPERRSRSRLGVREGYCLGD